MPRGLLRIILILVVPALLIAGGLLAWLAGGRYVETENAYVKTDIVHVGSEVDGRVVEVAVRDHDVVAAGDVLFRIDPAPFEIALAQAEAEVAAAAYRVAALRAEYRAAEAELGETEERVRFHTRQVERLRNLRSRGVASVVQDEEARLQLGIAREQGAVIRARMRHILASLGGSLDRPTEQQPVYLEAVARRDKAALDLERSVVRASVPGTISNMRLQPGTYLEAGDRTFALIASESPWVEANLKETQLTHVRVGQSATVTVDAYPGHRWDAVVDTISPATGAEFAVLPPQNATGNWVKVVQRLPVRLRLLDPTGGPPLRAGMTAFVSIDTKRERDLGDMLGD